MISSALGALLVVTAAIQVRDNVTRTQEAFTTCLGQVSERMRNDAKSIEDFGTALPQQCADQERAYREAMVRRDTSSRIARADAEQSATEEIEYARQNVREMYADAVTPR